jgi:hypothetical protein
VLHAVGQATDDLSPFLSTWLDPPTEPAGPHLAAFIDETRSLGPPPTHPVCSCVAGGTTSRLNC